MTPINSYPSVYAIGHKAIADLFGGAVIVEEKIDGSQFSMGILDDELQCRSKGKALILDAPEKMFGKAIETARSLPLTPGWVYRCEYLSKPKHNTLAYGRIPANGLIVFDIQTGIEDYLPSEPRAVEAARIGLECVPVLYTGLVANFAEFSAFLERESILGGCKVEGIVVKNYALFTPEKKIAIGKYVSEAFKEKHEVEWKSSNPSGKDVVQKLIETYRTPARWQKAAQHLRDNGLLEGSPRDIGALIREAPADVLKECGDEIKEALFKHYWPQIQRGLMAGLPEWYKAELAQTAFLPEGEDV